MITADEARKQSGIIREQIAIERRNNVMKEIEEKIISAIAKGETRINVILYDYDVQYIRDKVMEAGYEVAMIHDGIAIRWER